MKTTPKPKSCSHVLPDILVSHFWHSAPSISVINLLDLSPTFTVSVTQNQSILHQISSCFSFLSLSNHIYHFHLFSGRCPVCASVMSAYLTYGATWSFAKWTALSPQVIFIDYCSFERLFPVNGSGQQIWKEAGEDELSVLRPKKPLMDYQLIQTPAFKLTGRIESSFIFVCVHISRVWLQRFSILKCPRSWMVVNLWRTTI